MKKWPENFFGALSKTSPNEKYHIFIEISIPGINIQLTIWKFSRPNSTSSLMPWFYETIWNSLCSMQKLIKFKKAKYNWYKGYLVTQCKGWSQWFVAMNWMVVVTSHLCITLHLAQKFKKTKTNEFSIFTLLILHANFYPYC